MASRAGNLVQILRSGYPWSAAPLVVGAPMRVLSGAHLAIAVSHGGGLGFIGPGAKPSDLNEALQEASSLAASSVHLEPHAAQHLPVGIGIQTWAGDLKTTAKILQEHRPSPVACWLFAPRHGQSELDDWSSAIREASPSIQIWIQVASVADAHAAATSTQRPDVLVIQGHDAGGHSLKQGAGIITLLPEVLDLLHDELGITDLPVIAAGGVADARGAAAALTLGASGVAIGTRLLASEEIKIDPGYQRHILNSNDGGQTTVRTQLYNHLRGTTDWPDAFDPRGLVNQTWHDHKAGMSFEENKQLHDDALKMGEKAWGEQGRTATYAGTNVGLIKGVKGAGDIVREIRGGVRGVMRQAQMDLDDSGR